GPAPDEATRMQAMTGMFQDRLQAGDRAALLLFARLYGPAWQVTGSEAGRIRVAVMTELRSLGLFEAAELMRGGQRMLILPARPGPTTDDLPPGEDAWLTRDWLQLVGLTEGAHNDLARRMQSLDDQQITASEDPDLERVAETLADTAALRVTVEAVLRDPSPTFRSDTP
ncbi:MAG: hypothetical protein KJP02_06000, partial [Octadecabacter sp.]|nr:hypothetical protein [Octadecabacter sp.]